METIKIAGVDEFNTLGVDIYRTRHIIVSITYGRYQNDTSIQFSENMSLIQGAKELKKILKSSDFDLQDEEDFSKSLATHIFGLR